MVFAQHRVESSRWPAHAHASGQLELWRFLLAPVGGLFLHLKYKVSMLRDNILINNDVLHGSYLSGVEKVIAYL